MEKQQKDAYSRAEREAMFALEYVGGPAALNSQFMTGTLGEDGKCEWAAPSDAAGLCAEITPRTDHRRRDVTRGAE